MRGGTNDGEAFEGRAYRGHGDIYRWLREHYEYMEGWIRKRNPPGDEIAARIARDGIVGVRGKAPTSRSVRKVWARVCRDVEAERARGDAERAAREALAERRRTYPSRQPATQPVVAEASGRAVLPAGGGQAVEAKTAATESRPPVKENTVQAAKRRLACISGKRPMSDF
jgi:hypothetical protein